MCRFKQIVLLALACVAIVSACDTPADPNQPGPTAAPTTADAEIVARSFLDGWVKNDYAGMYSLISPKSLLISQEDFTKVYENAEQIIRPGDQGKSYELLNGKTERQGTTAIVFYNMTFKSATVGEFTDANRMMRLVITPRGWRVAWSTMDIFEGMAGGAVLSLDRTQSPRGTIYDRNGKVIAQDNVPNVAVRLVPGKYPTGNAQDCFRKLADMFRLKYGDLAAAYGQYTQQQYGSFGFTIGHLSKDDYDARHGELDAVCKIDHPDQTTRFYYGGGLAPQTIGFVGPIPAEQLGDYPNLAPDALVGRQGIEQYWEKQLAGESGAQLTIVMPNGIQIRTIYSRPPSPSQDMTLTIDREVQVAAERALAGAFSAANWAQFSSGAAAIVLDVNTGEVLALANFPSVDPDAFLRSTTFDTPATQLAYDRRRALRNHATQDLYALGSVFKIVSMAAAADTDTFKLTQTYTCTGQFPDPEQPGGFRKDWIYLDKYVEQRYHGTLTLIQALTGSCDTYFWEIGKTLNGIDADYFRKYANQMGLGVKTGIDAAVGEAEGYIPDPETKVARGGKRWGVGDSLNTVIGQGDVQVTPIEVARMMMGIANGGTLYRPFIVKSVGAPGQAPSYVPPTVAPGSMNLKPTVLKGIQQGLCDVPRKYVLPGTKDQNLGTANFIFYNWDFNRIAVCGKTGTAQTASNQPNGWFAAYAGKAGQKPDIAVVVIVERSREGSETAAPIVRRIVESYYKLPQEPWPEFWSYPYEDMPDPSASDGGGPRKR
jgi:penicillin-binding protein 2